MQQPQLTRREGGGGRGGVTTVEYLVQLSEERLRRAGSPFREPPENILVSVVSSHLNLDDLVIENHDGTVPSTK